MGTEILPPSDVLIQQLRFFQAAHKPSRKPRRKPAPKGPSLDRAPSRSFAPGDVRCPRRAPPTVDDLVAYAGSGFSQSPSPRALPMPSFSKMKEGFDGYDDLAARDLRRLLRIE
ncbi:hypothetical protein ACLOJK_018105 [Asimina triloba]